MSDVLNPEILADILRQSAGEEDGFSLQESNLDTSFDDLGYDSLALLQVTGTLQRQYGLAFSDEDFLAANTPRKLITLANTYEPAAS